MSYTVVTQLIYLALAVPLTIWVARVLNRHGQRFLVDVFVGNEELAQSVNTLLVIGFYLLSLGYVVLRLTTTGEIATAAEMISVLGSKVGTISIVLGVVHLTNVFVFHAMRRRAIESRQPAQHRGAQPRTGQPLPAPYPGHGYPDRGR
jgi:hypothetical protein